MNNNGWYGTDLDGTLAEYHGWEGPGVIGPPVPAMLERVKAWRTAGQEVHVVTARANPRNNPGELAVFFDAWTRWSSEHLGEVLPVRADKDFRMVILFDDRCRQVEANTGRVIGDA